MIKHTSIYFLLSFFLCQSAHGYDYKWKWVDSEFDSIANKLEEVDFMDLPHEAFRPEVMKLRQIANMKKNPVLSARAVYWNLWLKMGNDHSSAMDLVDRTLSSIDTLRYKYDYNRFLYIKGRLLHESGEWFEAFRIFKKLEKEFIEEKDRFNFGMTCIALGVLFNDVEEYENALKYLLQGEDEFKKLHCINCEAKNKLNISNTLYQLGEKDKSVHILKGLIKNPEIQNDTIFQIGVMVSLFSASDFKEAIYSQKAYELAKRLGNKNVLASTLVNRGAYFLMKANADSALYCYRQAYLLQKRIFKLQPILYGLNQSFELLGQVDSAYHYLKKYESYRDSLLPNLKMMEINKLVVQAEIEKYEMKLSTMKEKARLRRNMMLMVSAFLLIVTLLTCYIFWTLRKREKDKRQLKELENNQLAIQFQNEKLLNEKFQLEIDSKNRELSSTTLILSEKNNRLKELLKQVERFNEEGELGREQSAMLSKQIKSNLTVDDEWKYFKLHFEKVHPEYFTKLKEIAPSLSENDLRLCAYVRIGMTNKQIGQMLSVLPETVKTARYRMRKKIGLEGQETLEDFLRRI